MATLYIMANGHKEWFKVYLLWQMANENKVKNQYLETNVLKTAYGSNMNMVCWRKKLGTWDISSHLCVLHGWYFWEKFRKKYSLFSHQQQIGVVVLHKGHRHRWTIFNNHPFRNACCLPHLVHSTQKWCILGRAEKLVAKSNHTLTGWN